MAATTSWTGGDGDDQYYITQSTDLIVETNANQPTGGFDVVHTQVDYTLAANVEQLMLDGGAINGTGNAAGNVLYGLDSSHALTLDGGAGNDALYGSLVGGNTLIGGDGVDTLLARGGNNTLTGGDGNDIYYSDSASDIIVETNPNQTTGGFDTMYANFSAVLLADNVEQLILQGSALTGTGNATGNHLSAATTHGVTLDGGAGADIITGTAYDDILIGGLGNDQLDLRSGGHDTIAYTIGGFGNDIVHGFDWGSTAGLDFIDVAGLGFSAESIGNGISIAESGSDTLITIGSGSIRLIGVNATLVGSGNFKF